ncbi:PLDc_N domain-containing protein [Mycetocola tolaasinivorans]|uniref:PLDc_N domain-containing protein n=1 Tax=Mycetocola tolaasinivorans TaxID=76635 RepID=A0A3L7A6C6_9MICO|nr:PLD nuclease N-terminal domain-containing protein [Mycetocola tolaasinivorans]RLP75684.1 PLDc_N domain-containing protein [Mycetocola tolaasinivorans]
MPRFLFALVVVLVVATVYTVVDCALRDNSRIRGLSKPVWLVVILLLPVAGLALWYTIGRSRGPAPQPRTPDDDPAFLGDLRRVSEQDERIRRLEEELAALDAEIDLDDPKYFGPRDGGNADGGTQPPQKPGSRGTGATSAGSDEVPPHAGDDSGSGSEPRR